MEKEVEIEHRLTAVEARSASNTKRIDAIEDTTKALTDLASSMKVMAAEQKTIASTVEKLDKKVDDIESRPAKRYDGIVEKIIWAIVAAVVTYILSHVGL